jgi:hypothetical protein
MIVVVVVFMCVTCASNSSDQPKCDNPEKKAWIIECTKTKDLSTCKWNAGNLFPCNSQKRFVPDPPKAVPPVSPAKPEVEEEGDF